MLFIQMVGKMRIKYVDDLLYRGSHPVTPGDFASLGMNKVKMIINLESGIWERFKGNKNYELEMATQFGINVTSMHMSCIFPPKKREIQTVLNLIEMHRKRGETVFFHCFQGRDCTGAIAASYRVIVQKWSIVRAMREMLSDGHNWYLRWWDGQIERNLIGLLKKNGMM